MPVKSSRGLSAAKTPAAISRRETPAVSHRERLMVGAVLLVTLLLYLRCLGDGFVFDDASMIVKNRFIGSWAFFWNSFIHDSWWFMDPTQLPQSSYYRPLQDTWFGIHFHLFGLNPAGWHATMVALNLVVVWLVFKIAVALTGELQVGLLAALLFGVMPVHAEAVVWVSAIPLPLSAALELGALYLFISRAGGGARNWLVALLLYAGALLTHESAVAFPVLVALYVFLLESLGGAGGAESAPSPLKPRLWSAMVCATPFAILTLLYLALRWWVLGFISRPMPVNRMTGAQTLLTIPEVLATDLVLLVIPWVASPAHHPTIVTSPASPRFYLPAAALVVLAAAFGWSLRNHPRRRLYLFCAIWAGIAIGPMMNLRGIFQGALIQDRYLYVPSLGWCVMVADVAIRFARKGVRARQIALAGAAALIVVYAASLWSVQGFWHDNVAFYTRLVEVSPEEPSWHYAFGVALEDRADLVGAEREYKKALSLDPASPALYDLGVVHARLGRFKEAATEQAEGLKRLTQPRADAYVGLAQIYELNGDQARSEAALKYAESLPGGDHVAALARAQIKFNHADISGAETILRDLAGRDPYDPRVWTMLGLTAAAHKLNQEALANYQRAMALAPRDPFSRFLAALALHKLGRDREALEQCRVVLALSPNDANALALMAKIERGLSR